MLRNQLSLLSKYPIYVLAMIIAALCLFPRAARHAYLTGQQLSRDLPYLLSHSREQRQLETYGDSRIMGWGYIKRILKGLPAEDLYPLVRYPYYGMNVELVLPGKRTRLDKNMLVGIDLRPQDVQESLVTKAQQISSQSSSSRRTSIWIFTTTWDYDTLNALEIEFGKENAGPQNIRAVLLHSHERRHPIGTWEWTNQLVGKSLRLVLKDPVSEVYQRGSLPFVLILENAPSQQGGKAARIENLNIRGIKVNLSGYQIVHQEGYCFTALKTGFLEKVFREDHTAWKDYLKGIANTTAFEETVLAATGTRS